MTNRPYADEARRRLDEWRKAVPNKHGFLDDEIIQLMADYAAEQWQEGYDEGYEEGLRDGYGSGAGW